MSAACVGPHGAELHRAADPARDQSYFLFATTRDQLDYPALPARRACPSRRCARSPRDLGLAGRGQARQPGHLLRPRRRLCARWSRRCGPRRRMPGEIVDLDGRVLGRHDGLIHFTVGQRRGLEHRRPGRAALRRSGSSRRRARVVVGPEGRARGAQRAAQRRQLARRGPARRADRQGPLDWRGRRPPASTARRSASRRPNMASRPARRRCSTRATACSAAAGSRRRWRRSLPRWRRGCAWRRGGDACRSFRSGREWRLCAQLCLSAPLPSLTRKLPFVQLPSALAS